DFEAVHNMVRPIYDEPRFNDSKRGFSLWRVGRFYDRFPDIERGEYRGQDPTRRCALLLEEKRSGRAVGVSVVIKPEDPDATVGELALVYLAPEYRGLGLGAWMVETVIRQAKKVGYKRLQLMTRIEFGDAIALYEKVGFRQVT